MAADTIFIIAARSRPRVIDEVVTSTVEMIGSGEALCIVDNKIIRGTWRKESAEKPLFIYDEADRLMTRKDGKLWIQVVDRLEDVRFGK